MTIVQVASCQKKGQNLTYKVNFLCQKSTEFFYFLFSFKNINLGANFWPKICPILYYLSLKNSTTHITIFHSYYSSSESESSNSCLGNQFISVSCHFFSRQNAELHTHSREIFRQIATFTSRLSSPM